jgi:alpha-1,3/alpha-1,6-mannosyltransferase
VILVNSKFTSRVFGTHFSSIKIIPQVVYPGINIDAYKTSYDPNVDDPDLAQVVSCVYAGCLHARI